MVFDKGWFPAIGAMQREMERLLDDFARRKPPAWQFAPRSWQPAIDIYQTDDNLVVLVELAGVGQEDIELIADGTTLTIRGQKRHALEARSCHQLEIYWGPFEMVISLPIPVDSEAARAVFEDGILEVILPRAGSQSHRLTVKTSGS